MFLKVNIIFSCVTTGAPPREYYNEMIVNAKKPITLPNRTNYFIPDKDKVRVTFGSPHSYQSRSIKIEGYETRLYWQFKYCEDHDGQTFFYTLTYNDKAMPKYKVGVKNDYRKRVKTPEYINCFDYEDLRDLLTGGFRKRLLRKYGCTFKYFIGAELGDGKGKRGMHNNPHYHVLLFVVDAHNPKYPYVKIEEKDMTHLMRLYWQGVDQDDCPDKFFDYRDFNKGVVKEGELGAKVKDFRAIAYCAKYVTKDVNLVKSEAKVERYLRITLRNECRYLEETYKGFFHDELYPLFNTPINAKRTKWCFNDVQLIKELQPDADDWHKKVFGTPLETMDNECYAPYVTAICEAHSLWSAYEAYVDKCVDALVQQGINDWRNRYSNKCRVSHGLGDYALDFIDKDNPTIQVPNKDGFKNRPISMYYYRKMYCDVVKDPEGNNLYVLNEDGIKYKSSTLPKRIRKTVAKCKDYLPMLIDSPRLYDSMRDSDVNTEVFWTHSQFKDFMTKLLIHDNYRNILNRYAEYKLVYEDRFFSYQIDGNTGSAVIPDINVTADYERFLVPSFYSVSRDDLRLVAFLENPPENYLPYSQHEYFSRYIGVFDLLDLCSDYFFVQGDNQKQKDAEDRAATKRFHSQRKLKEFYAGFTH